MKRLHTIQDAILNIMEGSRGFKANQRRIAAAFKGAEKSGQGVVGTEFGKEILTRQAINLGLPVQTGGGKSVAAGRVSRLPYIPNDGKERKSVTGWEPRTGSEGIVQAHDVGIDKRSIESRSKVGTQYTGARLSPIFTDQNAQKFLLDPKTKIEPSTPNAKPHVAARKTYTGRDATPASTPNPTAQLDTRISNRQAGAVQTVGREAFPPAPPTMIQRVGAALSKFVKAG